MKDQQPLEGSNHALIGSPQLLRGKSGADVLPEEHTRAGSSERSKLYTIDFMPVM